MVDSSFASHLIGPTVYFEHISRSKAITSRHQVFNPQRFPTIPLYSVINGRFSWSKYILSSPISVTNTIILLLLLLHFFSCSPTDHAGSSKHFFWFLFDSLYQKKSLFSRLFNTPSHSLLLLFIGVSCTITFRPFPSLFSFSDFSFPCLFVFDFFSFLFPLIPLHFFLPLIPSPILAVAVIPILCDTSQTIFLIYIIF